MAVVKVYETFCSVQGESSFAGQVCFFIRLAGCNLRCGYCDSADAYEGGEERDLDDLFRESVLAEGRLVEITGGEPLLQESFPELAELLCQKSRKTVLVETNGSCDISLIPEKAIAIVDVKCPSSGESGSFDHKNISRLRPRDEVKFVLGDRTDYDWAVDFIRKNEIGRRCSEVLFSPVHGVLDPGELANWMIRDGLDVRLQLQLHKLLGVK